MELRMNRPGSTATKALAATVAATTLLTPLLGSAQQALAAPVFPDPAMSLVWNRTDLPVQDGVVSRSWMWGPEIFYSAYEAYQEGPGGQHLVAYFDKSRMEINNPNGDRNNPFFVTNGLLVVEMMTGRIQTGDNNFIPTLPADRPVAGDASSSLNAPTYASLAAYASLNGDNRSPNRTGQRVNEGLQRSGGIGVVDNLGGYATYSVYDNTLGHNIPDVFWNFMTQTGPVYSNGTYSQGTIIDWVFAMGYPLTEAYWIPIQVGSEQRWVLMQAFQRRILTYSPGNPQGFQVEMGNVGRTYYDWRYGQTPVPPPTPTPQPTPAAGVPGIVVNPSQGDAATTITVNGVNFPRNSQVVVQVERGDANYVAGVATVNTDGNGAFQAGFRLPPQATRYNSVVIAANSGNTRATANYNLSFNPRIDISPKGALLSGGTMNVAGSGFPAGVGVQVGIQFEGSNTAEYPVSTRTDGNGTFQAAFNVGTRSSGARFSVFAIAEGGAKANFNELVTIYNNPTLQVIPTSGPAGVNVTLQGTNWPAGQGITIGYRGAGDASEAFAPTIVTADAAGRFVTTVFIDRSLESKRQVIFSASGQPGVRIEAAYTITGTPPPPPPPPTQPVISVNPSALQVGQGGTITGNGWTPGTQVTITFAGSGAQETVASATVAGNGTFQVAFTLSGIWNNAGVLQVSARSNNNLAANATLTVLPQGNAGGALEYGLNMTVQTYTGVGGDYVKVVGRGWQPGTQLTISVLSARGDLNVGVGSALVRDDGTWQMSFDNVGPWRNRADVGVRASDRTNTFASGRRLPLTNFLNVAGGTYQIVGFNWVPGSKVEAALLVDGGEADGLGSIGVDGSGNFALSVVIPRASGERSIRVISTGGNGIQYEAVLGVDGSGARALDPSVNLDDPLSATGEAAPGTDTFKASPIVGMPRTGNSDAGFWWLALPSATALLALGLVARRKAPAR